MKLKTLLATGAIIFSICQCAESDLMTGPIVDVHESVGSFSWGDGINNLKQQWSSCTDTSGWLYGSSYFVSNADVYRYPGLADITTVSDASVFPYASSYVRAWEGDYVFFRGVNGYYGAWRIDDIRGGTYLNGQWYFQDDGSANFVPAPGALMLASIGVGLVSWLRARRKL